MAAAYAERSPDGPDHFGVVAAKGFHLFGIEPELTAAFFAGLPEAQLAIVPGASHGLPMEHLQEVVGLIERFLGSDVPPVTHRDEDGQRLKEVNRRTPRCPAPGRSCPACAARWRRAPDFAHDSHTDQPGQRLRGADRVLPRGRRR